MNNGPEHHLLPDETPATTVSAATQPGAWQRLTTVLRIPRFMIFTASQAISHFGDQLNYMALLAMIAVLAAANNWESSRANSFLVILAALPTVVFGPLAGVLIDRWNRVKVMFICDLVRCVIVFLIPFVALRTQSLPLIFSVAFVVFFLGLFFNTARLSVIPELVQSRNILEANSVITLAGRLSIFLGLLLGGLIVDWSFWRRLGMSESWAAGFYLDAFTFLISAAALGLILFRTAPRRPVLPSADGVHPASPAPALYETLRNRAVQVIKDFSETYRLMRSTPALQLVMFSVILFTALGAAVVVLLVPIIQTAPNDLRIPQTKGVGFVGTVGATGLVLSSLFYGFIGRRLGRNIILINFLLLGLIAIIIALVESLLLMLALAFIAGLLLAPIYISQDTLIHETIPEKAHGRVFAAREWFFNLSGAVMAFLIGQLILVMPKLSARGGLPLGIILDHRRLLLATIGFIVFLLCLIRLLAARRQVAAETVRR